MKPAPAVSEVRLERASKRDGERSRDDEARLRGRSEAAPAGVRDLCDGRGNEEERSGGPRGDWAKHDPAG